MMIQTSGDIDQMNMSFDGRDMMRDEDARHQQQENEKQSDAHCKLAYSYEL